MTTLTTTSRGYAGETDLQPIADLVNACEAVDQIGEGTDPAELQSEFGDPQFNPARDIRIWEDAEGRMIGFGQIWIPAEGEHLDGFLWFRVHPEARGNGLETEVIDWGSARMAEVGRERGETAIVRVAFHDKFVDRIALVEQLGFVADRYFLRMVRSLQEPIPEPQFPEGYTLRPLSDPVDDEQWIAAYNNSFIDHWNHHPLTVERTRHYNATNPYYRRDGDLVAEAPDGTFAAFCYCEINAGENERSGQKDGWIGLLGTQRGYRKLGLGRAMLLAGMRYLQAQGMEHARLGVDADSPTGATRLYEAVGFGVAQRRISLAKQVTSNE